MKRLVINVIVGCIVLMQPSCTKQGNDQIACDYAGSLETLEFRFSKAWAKSHSEFTNVAHKACCTIFLIADPTNRLQHARAYAEAVLALPKRTYDCDFAGLTARMIACMFLTDRLPDDMPFSLEFKWEVIARWWLQMKDEMAHYDSFGPRLPNLMYSGIMFSKEAQQRAIEEIEAENKRRAQYDRQREHARKIRGFLRGHYKFTYERRLLADCANLSNQRKDALLQMVIDATDKVPEWYRKDLAGRGLVFNLQSMSLKALDRDSIVGASGQAVKVADPKKDDVKVDVDL